MTINQSTKLLVVSPHPDDEALGCGGLIGKCLKEKARVFILYISVGDSRQLVTRSTKETLRLQEIKAVKQFTKAEVKIVYKGSQFCRLDTVPQKDLIEKIEDAIEDFEPNLIAIPSSSSFNQDHRAVFDACIAALRPVPKIVRHFISYVIEYYEPYLWASRDAKQPNVYLSLEEKYRKGNLLDFKINLYKCHKTQVRKNPFPRSPENLMHLAHTYGKEIGVDIAEAYHLIREELC